MAPTVGRSRLGHLANLFRPIVGVACDRRPTRFTSCAAHTDNRANTAFSMATSIPPHCPCHPRILSFRGNRVAPTVGRSRLGHSANLFRPIVGVACDRRPTRFTSCAAHTDNRANTAFSMATSIPPHCPCHPRILSCRGNRVAPTVGRSRLGHLANLFRPIVGVACDRRPTRFTSCAAHTDNRANTAFSMATSIPPDCPCHPLQPLTFLPLASGL